MRTRRCSAPTWRCRGATNSPTTRTSSAARAGDRTVDEEENVESSARQHFERACELAARLAAAPADAEAARELVELTQQLAADADLLDDAVLKSRARDAAAAARQLIGKPDAALAKSLSQVLAPPAAEPAPAPAAAPLPQSQAAADRS